MDLTRLPHVSHSLAPGSETTCYLPCSQHLLYCAGRPNQWPKCSSAHSREAQR
jgi:hypothetical protein